MEEVTVRLSDFGEEGICVSSSAGDKAYQAIKAEIELGHRITISFGGVTRLTTAFLNSAIGRLYREFSRARLKKQFAPPIDAETWQLNCLKRSIDRAVLPENTKDAVLSEVTGEGADGGSD